jgi:16S rRNA (uracil1498-N3)-methyltransferase
MHYFYSDIKVSGNTAAISEEDQLHHLRDVLRLKVNERITVFDSAGNEYLCTLSSLGKKEAGLVIESKTPAQPGKTKLAVACAIPRLSGMDDIIDKLTQLDVDLIVPLQTERVIVRPHQPGPLEGADTRLERWRKIGRNAAEQSRRRSLPLITRVMGLPEVLELSQGYRLKLIPTLAGERKSLKEISVGCGPSDTIALIGPEGDFTPMEVELAVKAGFVAVSLGETVLRVDTAAVAIASYLKLGLI